MKSILSALLLLACMNAISCFTEEEYRTAFSAWMLRHGRLYGSSDFQSRYNIFRNNMDYVEMWNKANKGSTLELNRYADLSNAEFRRIFLGIKFDGTQRLRNAPLASRHLLNAVRADTNVTVDWRLHQAVTPVKNQGQCGSCWSFSTTGSTEGAHALATGKLVSLSEQNLVDCSTAYGNEGCNGGLMDQAFEYIIDNKGIVTEASYPYTASEGTCKFNRANVAATISSYKDIPAGDEKSLMAAVSKQPVSVAIDASHTSFQLYSSGVYHEAKCSPSELDHGVLAVGYGTDNQGKSYWIVKNSWGADWGMNGYILMAKDQNNACGIATLASFPIV